MKDKPLKSKYRRISRSTLALMLFYSLWVADDHLLLVKSSGYVEEYTRIYLKEIKGIVSHRTKGWMLANIILGSILLLSGMGIISSDDILSAGSMAIAIFSTPVLIAFTVNLILGPTCRTEILTPLGPLHIPSLSRSRNIDKLLLEIRPAIASCQGSMPRSRLLSGYEEISTGVSSSEAGVS